MDRQKEIRGRTYVRKRDLLANLDGVAAEHRQARDLGVIVAGFRDRMLENRWVRRDPAQAPSLD